MLIDDTCPGGSPAVDRAASDGRSRTVTVTGPGCGAGTASGAAGEPPAGIQPRSTSTATPSAGSSGVTTS